MTARISTGSSRLRAVASSPLVQDVAQRVLTLNKLDQKRNLRTSLASLSLPRMAKVLDFGCGTGLFGGTINALGFEYFGYDIDPAVVDYATRLRRGGRFFFRFSEVVARGPYDAIVSNCCFHHISDVDAHPELLRISGALRDDGALLFLDLVKEENNTSTLRKLYNKLERGLYLRSPEAYRALVRGHFTVQSEHVFRSSLFSWPANPIYNDLVVMTCRKRHLPV